MNEPRIRQTRQRTAVAAALASVEEFKTAQQVHEVLTDAGEKVGLATVYRTLQSMAEAHEVDVIRTPDGQSAYRACVAPTHHHHLVCRSCGKTVEIALDGMEAVIRDLATSNGFSDVSHEIELFGLCSSCAGQATATPSDAGTHADPEHRTPPRA